MYKGPETGGGGKRRRPRWRIFYADRTIKVTSWYVEAHGKRIAVPELRSVLVCLTYRYPLVKVTAVMATVEAAIALGSAAVLGSGWMIVAGLFSTCTVATGALADYRRNPRIMSIEATVRGQRIVLFRSRDKQVFGQVWRALIRATEDNRGTQP